MGSGISLAFLPINKTGNLRVFRSKVKLAGIHFHGVVDTKQSKQFHQTLLLPFSSSSRALLCTVVGEGSGLRD